MYLYPFYCKWFLQGPVGTKTLVDFDRPGANTLRLVFQEPFLNHCLFFNLLLTDKTSDMLRSRLGLIVRTAYREPDRRRPFKQEMSEKFSLSGTVRTW